MNLLDATVDFTDAERQTGLRLLKLATEIDRVEGYVEPHATLVAGLAVRLAERCGLHGADLQALKFASLIHDAGERALRREYLLRRTQLSADERIDLFRHPILGEQAAAEFHLSRKTQLLVRWHHEWWNGKGYPDGLSGESIPLGARILRVADTWSALISDRPYRSGFDPASARAIMRELTGLEADPQIVNVLFRLLDEEARHSYVSRQVWPHQVWNDPESATTAHPGFDPQLLNQISDEASSEIHDWSVHSLESRSRNELMPSSIPRTRRWLGFELSILRRLKFDSIAIPFSGRPALEWHMAYWGRQVLTNDIAQWANFEARAMLDNDRARPSDLDIDPLLHDVDIPRLHLVNPSLRRWMSSEDAAWFDRLWQNANQQLPEFHRAMVFKLGLAVGDYVFAFNRDTSKLRRPLSDVFRDLWAREIPPAGAVRRHYAGNMDAQEFIGQVQADLCFVRLPRPEGLHTTLEESRISWRESWVRGHDNWMNSLVETARGRLGDRVHSKDHYLDLVTSFLDKARHITTWAIVHVDDGFVSAVELGDLIRQLRRRVEVAYSKDFSAVLGGGQAYVLVANS